MKTVIILIVIVGIAILAFFASRMGKIKCPKCGYIDVEQSENIYGHYVCYRCGKLFKVK